MRKILETRSRRIVRDWLVKQDAQAGVFGLREDLARRYLSGRGVEIGPLTWPLRLPRGATVQYVDYVSREELVSMNRARLGEMGLSVDSIPRVDVVDDAERLASLAANSLDFVVANHVVEHLEDPIAGLLSMLRVVRPGGILFLTVPDARHTFDAPRPRTTVEHLLRDHREGPSGSRREHYEEWARFNEALPEERVASRVAEFEQDDARHHFHVWELEDFLELLRALKLPGELELAQCNEHEFAVILRKVSR